MPAFPYPYPPRNECRGQALLFILMAVTILAFVVLWSLDLHRIIGLKNQAQHAGDAAALSAARWQGITLNLVGELNLMAALALSDGDDAARETISAIQARLCFTGPMAGLMAAQVAAKNNRVQANDDFSRLLQAHADQVRNLYAWPFGNGMLFEAPYPDAWTEYAAMIDVAVAHGVAAAPDNTRRYTDRQGDHILLDPAFYDAVASRNWCWFYLYAPGLLDDYTDYRWWPPLPAPEPRPRDNSEIFSLGLRARSGTLRHWIGEDTLRDAARERDIDFRRFVYTNAADVTATWYVYDSEIWSSWTQMRVEGEAPFPLTGPLKPEFDYAGADAVVRVYMAAQSVAPDAVTQRDANLVWTAAAKPFGSLSGELPPPAYEMVLPAFREVRLIPVDASSVPAGGAFDIEWRHHVDEHLDDYLQFGPRRRDCLYCAQLATWEDRDFRESGRQWLMLFSDRCYLQPPGRGGRRGGGTRRGH